MNIHTDENEDDANINDNIMTIGLCPSPKPKDVPDNEDDKNHMIDNEVKDGQTNHPNNT